MGALVVCIHINRRATNMGICGSGEEDKEQGSSQHQYTPPEPAHAGFVELFGSQLQTPQDGYKPTTEVLAGKKDVLVYFGNYEEQPCRDYHFKMRDDYNA